MRARTATAPAPWPVVGLTVTAVLVAWWPVFGWMLLRYRQPDGYWGHGPLVPLVSLFLIWKERATLARTPRSVDGRGLWLLVPALALHLVGRALRIDSVSGTALLLLLPGLVVTFFGAAVLRRLWLPLGFLVFAIPLPMIVVAHAAQLLKSWVIGASTALLWVFGGAVEAEGSFLILAGGDRLLVDEECCGLRSLIALIALGTLMAATAGRLRPAGRWLLFALALPIALGANLLRVLLLAGVALLRGAEAAVRWHDPSSYAVYAVALVAYVALERLLATTRLGHVEVRE